MPAPPGARAHDPPAEHGAAARLAGELERRCHTGILLRAQGGCASQLTRDRRHERRGHDVGCRTVGLSLGGAWRFLRAADRVGAAVLLGGALECAVAEIDDWGTAWTAGAARDAVSHAIRCRITPA